MSESETKFGEFTTVIPRSYAPTGRISDSYLSNIGPTCARHVIGVERVGFVSTLRLSCVEALHGALGLAYKLDRFVSGKTPCGRRNLHMPGPAEAARPDRQGAAIRI
jgi:hypothetical protein